MSNLAEPVVLRGQWVVDCLSLPLLKRLGKQLVLHELLVGVEGLNLSLPLRLVALVFADRKVLTAGVGFHN